MLKSVYLEHKAAFKGFANKYDINDEDVLDIYQDAIIALRENALKGHLDDLKSELKTYLFGIGKYMIYGRLKDKKKLFTVESIEEPDDFHELRITQIDYNISIRQKQLQAAFKRLGRKMSTGVNLVLF